MRRIHYLGAVQRRSNWLASSEVQWREAIARVALSLGGDPDAGAVVLGSSWPAAAHTGLVGPSSQVVSVGWLSSAAEPERAFAQLVDQVADGGSLLLVEAIIPAGWRAPLARLFAKPGYRLFGRRAQVDLPARLRQAGFAITSLERISMATFCFPRTVVRLRARRVSR